MFPSSPSSKKWAGYYIVRKYQSMHFKRTLWKRIESKETTASASELTYVRAYMRTSESLHMEVWISCTCPLLLLLSFYSELMIDNARIELNSLLSHHSSSPYAPNVFFFYLEGKPFFLPLRCLFCFLLFLHIIPLYWLPTTTAARTCCSLAWPLYNELVRQCIESVCFYYIFSPSIYPSKLCAHTSPSLYYLFSVQAS